MNAYLLVKTVHILSSVVLVGTGFGSAFYLFFVNRSASLEARAIVGRLVVRADTWFTAPAVLIQPATGLWMAHQVGWPLTTPWILAACLLYVLTGFCWLPVVWLQWRMAQMAMNAVAHRTDLNPKYWYYASWWERLGYPAFIAMLLTFYLMVNKPGLWAS